MDWQVITDLSIAALNLTAAVLTYLAAQPRRRRQPRQKP